MYILIAAISCLVLIHLLRRWCRHLLLKSFERWKAHREIIQVKEKARNELSTICDEIKDKHRAGVKKEEMIPLYERTFILDEVITHPEEFVNKDF